MTSTRCPDCDTLREITPTDKPVGTWGTARRWRLVMHPGPTGLIVEGMPVHGVCSGSGKLI